MPKITTRPGTEAESWDDYRAALLCVGTAGSAPILLTMSPTPLDEVHLLVGVSSTVVGAVLPVRWARLVLDFGTVGVFGCVFLWVSTALQSAAVVVGLGLACTVAASQGRVYAASRKQVLRKGRSAKARRYFRLGVAIELLVLLFMLVVASR
jgi:hypothetical protein